MKKRNLSREAIARVEIGHTDISHTAKLVLTTCFFMLVFSVPLVQMALDKGGAFAPFFRLQLAEPVAKLQGESAQSVFAEVNYGSKTILKNMRQLETRLEEDSFLRQMFLPPLQYLFIRFLDQGNEKVLSGRDGYLFYSAGVDYLIGQPFLAPDQLRKREEGHDSWELPVQPDPMAAIVDFRDQLAQRGVELLLVPIPVKGSIEPEKLVSGKFTRPLHNRSWPYFIAALKSKNIQLFDAGSVLVDYSRHYEGAFLRTDTHWLPGAMESVAEKLAEYLITAFPPTTRKTDQRLREEDISGIGDIAKMLTLPENVDLFPEQQVGINQVLNGQQEFWQPDPESPILFLGDSFTNMYSFNGLGWGFGAGFAEHLSFRMKQPLDLIVRNDSGAFVTREMLARELLRGRDRLAGKKLVIWEFSERELSSGDWKMIKLELKDPVESGFFMLGPGEKISVTGMVSSASVSPRPGSVPYTDNIVTLHLVDLQAKGRDLEQQQAVVYGWGMRKNQLTELATVRPGDTVSFILSSWEDVEKEYGGFRRTPLGDEMLELELPNWGELTGEKKK